MFSIISTGDKNVNETATNERVCYIPNYDIIKISDDSKVLLIGVNNRYKVSDVWFKISRYSISEGIFESKLAVAAYVDIADGNAYKIVTKNNKIVYLHAVGEYLYIGGSIDINE